MRIILMSAFVLAQLFYSPIILCAKENKILVNEKFMFQIHEDGRKTNRFILGNITIIQNEEHLNAIWNDIFFAPWVSGESYWYQLEQHTSSNGSISDLLVGENWFSFNLKLIPLIMQITGKKEDNGNYSVQGIGKRWESLGNKFITFEWKPIDEFNMPICKIINRIK